jgi:hypothetical protein
LQSRLGEALEHDLELSSISYIHDKISQLIVDMTAFIVRRALVSTTRAESSMLQPKGHCLITGCVLSLSHVFPFQCKIQALHHELIPLKESQQPLFMPLTRESSFGGHQDSSSDEERKIHLGHANFQQRSMGKVARMQSRVHREKSIMKDLDRTKSNAGM